MTERAKCPAADCAILLDCYKNFLLASRIRGLPNVLLQPIIKQPSFARFRARWLRHDSGRSSAFCLLGAAPARGSAQKLLIRLPAPHKLPAKRECVLRLKSFSVPFFKKEQKEKKKGVSQ